MIRRSEEKQSVRKPAPFNGVGEITVRSLLNGPEEMSQKGRVFGHTTVYPGSEIGYHIHTGDSETYYILSGKGLYNDNGTEVEIGAGDVTYCAPGEGHGLKCLGDEPIEMIALILYEYSFALSRDVGESLQSTYPMSHAPQKAFTYETRLLRPKKRNTGVKVICSLYSKQ